MTSPPSPPAPPAPPAVPKPDVPPTPPAAATARALEKQERLARVYDDEVWPVFAQKLAALLLDALTPRPGARVVEVGCATGGLTLELARRFDAASRIVAIDEAPFVAHARPKLEADPGARGRVTFELGPAAPLALPDASAELVVSNLGAAAFADPPRAFREIARVLAPGGQAIITTPLRGSWAEFLDIYRDVLLDSGTPESVVALDQYVGSLPDGATATTWLKAAGLVDVELTVERWEILFKSAREFFFAPLVELGPLSRWKRIAGRGEDMQDVFFFTKEAIDTYFKGAAFPITIVGAAVGGRKPAPTAPGNTLDDFDRRPANEAPSELGSAAFAGRVGRDHDVGAAVGAALADRRVGAALGDRRVGAALGRSRRQRPRAGVAARDPPCCRPIRPPLPPDRAAAAARRAAAAAGRAAAAAAAAAAFASRAAVLGRGRARATAAATHRDRDREATGENHCPKKLSQFRRHAKNPFF